MSEETRAKLFDLERLVHLGAVIGTLIAVLTMLWQFSGWYHDDMNRAANIEQRVTRIETTQAATQIERETRYREIITNQAQGKEKLDAIRETQVGLIGTIRDLQSDMQTVLRQVGGQTPGRLPRGGAQ